MGPGSFPDLTPLFYLAIVGLVALAAALVGGAGALIWFIVYHVHIV